MINQGDFVKIRGQSGIYEVAVVSKLPNGTCILNCVPSSWRTLSPLQLLSNEVNCTDKEIERILNFPDSLLKRILYE